MTRAVRVIAVLLLVLGGAVAATVPATAHNVLRSTSPVAGAQLEAAPEEVTLVFDEPAIALGTVVEVTGPQGAVLSEGAPTLRDTAVRQPVSSDGQGTYTVVWRVTSSDGHPIEGTFAYEVGGAEPGSASPVAQRDTTRPVVDDPGTGWALPAALVLAAAALAAGAWALVRRRRDGSSTGP